MQSRLLTCVLLVVLGHWCAQRAYADELILGDSGDGDAGAFAESADGRWLVTGQSSGPARVWDAENAVVVARLGVGCPATRRVDMTDDGRLVATLDHATGVRVWDWRSGEVRAHIPFAEDVHPGFASGLILAEHPLRAAWVERPNRISDEREPVATTGSVTECYVHVVELDETGRLLRAQGRIRHRRERLKQGWVCVGARAAPASSVAGRAELHFVVLGPDGRLAVLDFDRQKRLVHRLEGGAPGLARLWQQDELSYERVAGPWFAAFDGQTASIWDLRTGKRVRQWQADHGLNVSPQGLVLVGHESGGTQTLEVRDLSSWKIVGQLTGELEGDWEMTRSGRLFRYQRASHRFHAPAAGLPGMAPGLAQERHDFALYAYDLKTGAKRRFGRLGPLDLYPERPPGAAGLPPRQRSLVLVENLMTSEDEPGGAADAPEGPEQAGAGEVIVWDFESGTPSRIPWRSEFDTGSAASSDGRFRHVLQDGRLAIFDVEQNKEWVLRERGVTGGMAAGRGYLGAFLADGEVHVYDTSQRRILRSAPLPDHGYDHVRGIDDEARYVIVGASVDDLPVTVIDIPRERRLPWLQPRDEPVAMTLDGGALAAWRGQDEIVVVEVSSGKVLSRIRGVVGFWALGPGGKTIMTTIAPKRGTEAEPDFVLYEVATGRALGRWATSP